MTWVPALIDQGLGSFLFCADLCQFLIARVRFAEVHAKTALSVMYVLHGFTSRRHEWQAARQSGHR